MKKTNGPSKRFGVRYGKTVRKKVDEIERLVKKSYKCPFCHYEKVKRECAGIWKCEKCGKTFTSKAYTMDVKPSASPRGSKNGSI